MYIIDAILSIDAFICYKYLLQILVNDIDKIWYKYLL